MLLMIALSVVVSVEFTLYACGVPLGLSFLISVGAGIATLIAFNARRSRDSAGTYR